MHTGPTSSCRTSSSLRAAAGGSHHTSLGFDVTPGQLQDLAAISGIECVVIDEHTTLDGFRDRLRWNDLYWLLAKGL